MNDEDNEFRLFACALKISVSYAASIGGTGTLICSGPNIVFKGQADSDNTTLASLLHSCTIVPVSVKCTISERAEKDVHI